MSAALSPVSRRVPRAGTPDRPTTKVTDPRDLLAATARQVPKLEREIQISQWGNIYVEEAYTMVRRTATPTPPPPSPAHPCIAWANPPPACASCRCTVAPS